ncbi:hypothetical protein NC651_010937 [Populus alba x Populus x berolinensis]|nr:hypothetical protein NC651_010937 [Populus alba x Populus x berolinensis]
MRPFTFSTSVCSLILLALSLSPMAFSGGITYSSQDNLITRACYSRVQVRVAWHERAGNHQKNHSERPEGKKRVSLSYSEDYVILQDGGLDVTVQESHMHTVGDKWCN